MEKRKGQKDHFNEGNILHFSDRLHDKMLCIYHLGQNFKEHADLFGFLICNSSEDDE